MGKLIYRLEIEVAEDKKMVQFNLSFNSEDYDPEVIPIIKSATIDFSKFISKAYFKERFDFIEDGEKGEA